MLDMTRRAALAACTIPLAVTPALASAAMPDTAEAADRALEALWQEWSEIKRALHVNGLAHENADAKLPWWAAPGPNKINHKGEHVGYESGWPARQDVTPPTHPGSFKRLRESFSDIRGEFKMTVSLGFDRAGARQRYREQVRALVARMRAKEAEYKRLGLDVLSEEADALSDRLCEIEDAVDGIRTPTPNVISSRLLLALLNEEIGRDACAARVECTSARMLEVLELMHPTTSGTVHRIVGAMLADPERPFEDVALV